MFSSIRLFRLFGAQIQVHPTLFLFAALFVTVHVRQTGWESMPLLGAFYVAGFLSILIHEYGHIFVARLHGIDCRTITLHGLGGLAHLDSAPRQPRDEFLIALAGPVTSLLLSGVLWFVAGMNVSPTVAAFSTHLSAINLFIAGFNLLPAYPLDGGQMLHAVLRRFLPTPAADRASSISAQLFGAGLGVAGYAIASMNMMLIGAILFFLAPSWLGQRSILRWKRSDSARSEGEDAGINR